MKRLVALVFMVWGLSAHAQVSRVPPSVAAQSWVLIDASSLQVLASRRADERVEPASLTKLMTAYVVFSALKQNRIQLAEQVPVSERAWKTPGSRMFLEPSTPVSVDQLIHGLIIQSGNDASVALAEWVASSQAQFVKLMNSEAQRLGLKNTVFMNVTGLPQAGQSSSARDLALLTAALVRDFPEHYPIFAKKEFSFNKIPQSNRNRLLWLDPSVDGVKTGHTEAAGYCLIASAKRGPRRLVSVVMGAESEAARATESQRLLNWGFSFYETVKLYDAFQPVSELRIWRGADNTLKAGFLEDFVLSLPKGSAQKIQVSLESKQPLLAPLRQGDPVATLRITLDDKLLGEYPVKALNDVPVASLPGRAWDALRLWLQ